MDVTDADVKKGETGVETVGSALLGKSGMVRMIARTIGTNSAMTRLKFVEIRSGHFDCVSRRWNSSRPMAKINAANKAEKRESNWNKTIDERQVFEEDERQIDVSVVAINVEP